MSRDLPLILLAACLTLLPGLGQTRHLASRELRHAEIAREMAASGDFVVPTLLGEPYRDKPPVLHAAAATLYRVGGGPSIGLARLPSAIAAILAVLAIYALGRLVADRKAAFLAALGLATVQGFVRMGQQARPDMILGFAVTLGCLGFGWAMVTADRRLRVLAGLVAGLGIGLGTLTKGPYGVLFPVLFAILAPAGSPRLRRPPLSTWLAALPAFVLVLAVWVVPAWLRDGGEYLKSVILQPDLTSGSSHHARPFYYYLGPILPSFLPLTLLLPALFLRVRRFGAGPLLWPCVAIFAVLSVVPGKRVHYLVPLYPLLALAVADAVRLLAPRWPRLPAIALGVILVALPAPALYQAFVLPAREPPLSEDLAFARAVREIAGSDADLVCSLGLGEALCFVFERSDIPEISDVTRLRESPPPRWLAVEGRRPKLLEKLGRRFEVRPVPLDGIVPGGKRRLYALLPPR